MNTVYQDRFKLNVHEKNDIVQILNIKGNQHWVVLSNIHHYKETSSICIYDSLFSNIDDSTKNFIQSMTDGKATKLYVHNEQKQEGCKDCGLFSIAIATSLLYKKPIKFQQSLLRTHLISCLEKNCIVPFP
jgi:hypothetical protein